jgi:hypothetical protein
MDFSLGTRMQYRCVAPGDASLGVTVTCAQASGIVKSTMPPISGASVLKMTYLVAPGIGGLVGIGPV